MASDRERLRALRALAAEGSGATDAERALARKRADDLEKKLGPEPVTEPSPFTHNTTVTSRDGRFTPDPNGPWTTLFDLLNLQWQWNPVECLGCGNKFIKEPEAPMRCSECLAKDAAFYREADIVEDQYQEEPDEDYGYDIREGNDW